jgi:hypothetical protein
LLEKLLTKYLQKRGLLSRPHRLAKLGARRALNPAVHEIDSIDDKSPPPNSEKAKKAYSRTQRIPRHALHQPQATQKIREDCEQKLWACDPAADGISTIAPDALDQQAGYVPAMSNGRRSVRNDTESGALKKNANKANDSATPAAWALGLATGQEHTHERYANLIGRF